MLRISIKYRANSTTLRLEGKLVGPWIPELEQCWHGVTDTARPASLIVDLNAVSWVDPAGRALLREMHHSGATLEGRGLLSQLFIHWIVNQQPRDWKAEENHVAAHRA